MSTAYERALDHFIDLTLEEARKSYSSKIEPFNAYAERVRIKLRELFKVEKETLIQGYTLLLEAQADPAPFVISEDMLTNILSYEKMVGLLSEGQAIYELFGYTPEMLSSLYNAAHKIVEQQRFEEGYKAYQFLVTIAPNIREAWLNFGYTCSQLGKYLESIQAYGAALQLDPTKPDSYLAAAGCYLKLGMRDKAIQVCDFALQYANAQKDEQCAPDFVSCVEEAKSQIEQNLL